MRQFTTVQGASKTQAMDACQQDETKMNVCPSLQLANASKTQAMDACQLDETKTKVCPRQECNENVPNRH